MDRDKITQAIDDEISKLQHAKSLLLGIGGEAPVLDRLSGSNLTEFRRPKPSSGRYKLSEEGRRRIAEAQKRRWAKLKGVA